MSKRTLTLTFTKREWAEVYGVLTAWATLPVGQAPRLRSLAVLGRRIRRVYGKTYSTEKQLKGHR